MTPARLVRRKLVAAAEEEPSTRRPTSPASDQYCLQEAGVTIDGSITSASMKNRWLSSTLLETILAYWPLTYDRG